MRIAATVAGLIGVLVVTLALFGLPVGHSLLLMLQGAFGDKLAITRTLVKAIPLAITSMGIVVAWRARMYNIGGEGQFMVGGLCGAWVAAPLMSAGVPGWIGLPAILAASIVGGTAWGAIAGWLRVARGVEVVISTILLNFVAQQVLAWAVAGPMKDPAGGVPMTPQLPQGFMLERFDRQTDLHGGILIAAAVVAATYVFLYFTRAGFQTRLVGEGEGAARAHRIDAEWVRLRAMMLSGALCGLAGGVEYAGISGQLGISFGQGWGFLAIPVALIGGLHPLWVMLGALYFAALFAGSRNLAGFSEEGTALIYVIQGAAVLALVAFGSIRMRQPDAKEAI